MNIVLLVVVERKIICSKMFRQHMFVLLFPLEISSKTLKCFPGPCLPIYSGNYYYFAILVFLGLLSKVQLILGTFCLENSEGCIL